jgi:hypothetical protein
VYLNAIVEFNALELKNAINDEKKGHKELRQVALLFLRDAGQLNIVILVMLSSEAQFMEVTIIAPPFSLKFRIASDQTAILCDKADASDKLAIEVAMSKTLIGSGIQIDLPIIDAVSEDRALSKLQPPVELFDVKLP